MQLEANYRTAADFIRSAASQDAQLAVLPEYVLTGWVPKHPDFKDAAGQGEKYLRRFQELARRYNINIVPGTIVQPLADQDESESGLVNMAYFIDNRGDVLGSYQKKNLWWALQVSTTP